MNNVLNLFGLGKVKFSASIASLLALALFITLREFFSFKLAFHVFIFLFIILLTLLSARKNLKEARKDSKEIVIDEFLGMYLLAFLANASLILSIFLFLVFRIVDLTKIWPFFYLDRMKSNSGFLLDDLAIGFSIAIIYSLITLWI